MSYQLALFDIFLLHRNLVVIVNQHTFHLGYDMFLRMGGKFSIGRNYQDYYSSFQYKKIMMKKFPEDIQCIVEPQQGKGAIYISNIEVAENPQTLKKHGIEAVITAIKGKNLDKVIPPHIQYMYIPAVDHQSFDIAYYFQEANQFIHDERKRTNVLVHCMAGVSRSVSLVIAYLMKHNQKNFKQAFSYVKSKRQIIHPNTSFISQLQTYQKSLSKDSTPTQIQLRPQEQPRSMIKSLSKESIGQIRPNSMSVSMATKPTKKPQKDDENNMFEANYDQALKQNIRLVFSLKTKENQNGDKITRSLVGRNTVSNAFR